MPPRFIPIGGQGSMGGGFQGGGRFQPLGGSSLRAGTLGFGQQTPDRFVPIGGHQGGQMPPALSQPNSALTSLQGFGGGLGRSFGFASGLGLQVPHAGLIGGAGSLLSGAAGLAQPGTSHAQKAASILQTTGGGLQIAQDLTGIQVPGLGTALRVASVLPNIIGRAETPMPKGQQAIDAALDLGTAGASATPFGPVAGGFGTALKLLVADAFGKPAKSRTLADALETQGLSNVQNDVHSRVAQATTPDELYAAFGPVMDHVRTGEGDYPLLLDPTGQHVIPYSDKAAWLKGLASGATFAWQGGGSRAGDFGTVLTAIVRQRAALLAGAQSNPAIMAQLSQQQTAQGQQRAASDMIQSWIQPQVSQFGFTPPAPASLLAALQGGPASLSPTQAMSALQAANVPLPLPIGNDPALQNQVNLLLSQGMTPSAAFDLAQQQLANAAMNTGGM